MSDDLPGYEEYATDDDFGFVVRYAFAAWWQRPWRWRTHRTALPGIASSGVCWTRQGARKAMLRAQVVDAFLQEEYEHDRRRVQEVIDRYRLDQP